MSSLQQRTRFRINTVSSTSSSSFSKNLPLKIAHLLLFLPFIFMKFPTSAAAAPLSVSSTPATAAAAAADKAIILFEDAEFKGIRSRLYVGPSTCINLVGKLNDFFSSVDPMGGCYYLCEHQNCWGRCERVIKRESQLATMGLNDRVSSLRLCDDNDRVRPGSIDKPTERSSRSAGNSFPFVFLRSRQKRLRRSLILRPDQAESEGVSRVPSSFYDSFHKWRTHREREARTFASPFPPEGNLSVPRDISTAENSTTTVPPTEKRSPYQRLVRIRRPRQRRKWIK